MERTLVLIKPDGVQRALVGQIISRFEQRGLKVIALKMIKPTLEHLDNHYPKEDWWIKRLGEKGFNVFDELGLDKEKIMGTTDKKKAGLLVRKWLLDYMNAAPIVAFVLEGIHVIDMARKIVGPSIPNKAEIGTIRGDFSVDSPSAANVEKRAIKNLIHASETKEEAEAEIKHWFSEEEIYEWSRPDHQAMF
ncbi:nucleoside-diphosphate kinase [candidate division WS5 bacterium]|uniref:nucleoside-diphosphate kinase n=1 Tax=candidate division WS5 bacterium TaxID=2093353 RepID=A0A419DCG0_9BACT|nr:MAG: nucleoside-diphosphate kinase [candidate division WS5 bacterium]